MKKIAVGNMGEEELERMQRTVLTREETRAEADVLFGGDAKAMRKADRGMMEKLFVQTPGSVTMAPNLQKVSHIIKLASLMACGPDGTDSWLEQFKGTPLLTRAVELEEKSLQLQLQDMQRRVQDDIKYQEQDVERKEHWHQVDELGIQKRMLALELAKSQAGMNEEEAPPEAPPEGAVEEAPPQQAAQQPAQEAMPKQASAAPFTFMKKAYAVKKEKTAAMEGAGGHFEGDGGVHKVVDGWLDSLRAHNARPIREEKNEWEKTSSITPRIDEFFEKRAYLTDAQRRFPELQKVADSPTQKAISLKPRVTTDTSGPTPTKSSLSGGSA